MTSRHSPVQKMALSRRGRGPCMDPPGWDGAALSAVAPELPLPAWLWSMGLLVGAVWAFDVGLVGGPVLFLVVSSLMATAGAALGVIALGWRLERLGCGDFLAACDLIAPALCSHSSCGWWPRSSCRSPGSSGAP
jgi:hypothetical protein